MYLVLEMRILCKFLLENCDHLEHFITPVAYTPLNEDQKAIELKNQRYKIIREAKRTWLNHVLHAYESEIQEYEQQYQKEFRHLEAPLSNPAKTDNISTLHSVKDFLVEQTNQLRGSMCDEVSSSRIILLHNRQRASSSKDTIDVSPESYLDLISNPSDQREWNYLCLGSSCIRLNQSAARPRVQQEAATKKEHQEIFDKVQPHKELRKLLDESNTWHPNIKLDYQIGKSLPFLDVFLTNQNGILSTSIYHKPSAEPYVVPFISDHPRQSLAENL
ncbi:unnamed protein product [Didymodactylos carnosus]|uniref:Uncharacterized protein n=1 Tax=Didymodactylos carnosus TaxID=1234261 RepID=A0A814HE37_9BILA|nr:unnamed protein product [Didymodactylos carnosus]CAF1008573.1 unnamed protein product [Didymodactylos carnosus]CAF3678881.1 unnamed protein product [Didymodactylos carnosus]CAF3779691.1 unnamed protein product [Didymodactylos carnosus]